MTGPGKELAMVRASRAQLAKAVAEIVEAESRHEYVGTVNLGVRDGNTAKVLHLRFPISPPPVLSWTFLKRF